MALVVSEINTEIRYLLGGMTTSVMSDELLNFIIQRNIDQYGDLDENLCLVTYEALKEVLRYLVNKDAAGSAGTSGGAVIKRVEEIGKRRIEVSYSADGSGTVNGYQSLLDFYTKHPEEVCTSLKPATSSATVIVGGTSQKQYDKVADNPDSRNGWTMSNICNKYGSRNSPRNGSF
jgi:hypothetical protein